MTLHEALDTIVEKDPSFKEVIYALAENVDKDDLTPELVEERKLLATNRLWGFTFKIEGAWSRGFSVILAHSEEEAKARAMEYLKSLQPKKLEKSRTSGDWSDLDYIFEEVKLIPMNTGIGHIGDYIE